MDKNTQDYIEFMEAVDAEYKEYVDQLHLYLTELGCKTTIKPTRQGYLVSYVCSDTKKTVLNYVFRKQGMMMRIYANHHEMYADFIQTLPAEMVRRIDKAGDCKRMLNPEACNSRCTMGYDFEIAGKRYQKCRSMAFQFFLNEENNPFLKKFVELEMSAIKTQ